MSTRKQPGGGNTSGEHSTIVVVTVDARLV